MMRFKNIQSLSDRSVGKSTLGRLFIALAIFTFISALFVYIAREVIEGETLRRDTQLLLFINSFANPALDKIMLFITTIGDVSSVLTVTVAVLAVLFWKKRWHAFALVAFSIAGAAALNIVLKLVFERQRPHLWDLLVHESTYSFPSGHAMLTSSLALALIIVAWNTKWRWLVTVVGAVYVLAVGFSRMYLGVHYPTDIVAGWCVAAVWVIVVATILGVFRWQDFRIKSSKSQAKIHT
ncbi:MAG: phosphoesterase, PA-phosphatase-like protein [Candidatus Saccharibacteria bacterium]|nr:phosphoesterase, PA-phosphatase-like protein [Candidatus Saccharibacteria bacterium]